MVESVADEGIVMLENKNNALPLTETEEMNINVFGWSSIAPVYGGTGVGGANEDQNVTFLQGLANAGFNVNEELVEFYEGLGYERGANTSLLANFSHDFTVYEAETSDYDETLLSNAEEFSDVALIYIARLGGEGADLPMDMSEWGDTADKHALELSTEGEADSAVDSVKEFFEKAVAAAKAVLDDAYATQEEVDSAVKALREAIDNLVLKDEDPGTEEPGTGDPGTENPGTDEPDAGGPGNGSPGTGDGGNNGQHSGADAGQTVRTGDSSAVFIWIFAASAAAAVTLGAALVIKRKIRK